MNRQARLMRAAPHATSHGRNSDEVDVMSDLIPNQDISEAELSALELLVSWDWLERLLRTCGGSDPDV